MCETLPLRHDGSFVRPAVCGPRGPVRSGAPCVKECHVVMTAVLCAPQFVGLVGQFAQAHQLAELRDVLPSISHQFSPLFAADHAVAM